MTAELIIVNANVITVDKNQPKAEAFAVKNGRFAAVGSSREVLEYRGSSTEVIDLAGATVVPGFNDSHMHLLGVGSALESADLTDARSVEDLITIGKRFYQRNSELQWIVGRGWNHERFTDGRMPTRYDLDQISTEVPILFTRVCGHIAVANSKALELAGLAAPVEQPAGGYVDVSGDGEPTGVLRERAIGLVGKLMPAPQLEDYKRRLEKGARLAVSLGLTTVQSDDLGDINSMPAKLQAYKELLEEGRLPLRVNLQVRLPNSDQIREFAEEVRSQHCFPEHTVEFGPIKLMCDGSLGGRTAALKQPYADDPTTSGVAVLEQEQVNEMITLAHNYGLQVSGHAIGDLAMQMLLNAFRLMLEQQPVKDARPRIIHAQLTDSQILTEMRELGVVCDIQPVFVGTDMHFVEKRIGQERAKTTYAWKTMRRMGIPTAGGSDAPVESCNPLLGIYAAVTRQDASGYPDGGWLPDEKLSVAEAVELFTMGSAYAAFDENDKGSITPGKLADFVILSEDVFAVEPQRIKDVKVVATYIGGQCVYR